MAIHAESHRVVDFAHGYGLRVHISMTAGAVQSGPDMRCMVEVNVRGWLKTINTLPRYILAEIPIAFKLLNRRFAGGNCLVTCHAEVDTGNPCVGSTVHTHMANDALQSFLEMKLVGEGNWLNRGLSPAYIFADCRESTSVFWSKDAAVDCILSRMALRVHRRTGPQERPS